MKITPLCALTLGLALALPASASIFSRKSAKSPPPVPTADATLKAVSAVMADSRARQAQLADQAKGLRRRLAAFRAKVKDPKAGVAEQLSKDDRDKFNLLTIQLRYVENAIVIEEIRQRNLQMVKDLYRASYFVAAEASEYAADKGVLDDDFQDFCQAKAETYKLGLPVALLFNAEDFVSESPEKPGAEKK